MTNDGTARRLYRAAGLLADARTFHADGAVCVGEGRVLSVGPTAEVARRHPEAQRSDLGDVVLAAGLVNAHAHLELAALAGVAEAGVAFPDWVGKLLAARAAADASELRAARARDAWDLVSSGTTCVADIDSLDLGPLEGPRPRRVVQRELLDARDPGRRAQALDRFGAPPKLGEDELEGVSPHAPFSISDELLAAIAGRVRGERLPLAMHWAETEDEVAWLAGEDGWYDRHFPRRPGMHGVDALERHGLLGATTSLIHGNHPRPGEPERIAAAGATVVHCPGSHAYFGRGAFPLAAYRTAGVRIALGTDSSASNAGLDMRRELALFAAQQPSLAPEHVWAAATENGARALGLEGLVGALRPGSCADLVAFDVPPTGRSAVLEELVHATPSISGVWIGGATTVSEGRS